MGGAGQCVAAPDALFEIASGELDGSLEQCRTGRSDPRDGGETGGVEVEKSAQPLRLIERRARDVDSGGATGTGLDEQCEKLRVGQHGGSSGKKLLARSLVARPVGNRHGDSVSGAAVRAAGGRELAGHAG